MYVLIYAHMKYTINEKNGCGEVYDVQMKKNLSGGHFVLVSTLRRECVTYGELYSMDLNNGGLTLLTIYL